MDIGPVDQVLCDCLGRTSDEALAERLNVLTPAEWEALVGHAENCGVAPLLYHRFKHIESITPFPANMPGRLRATYLGAALRNTLIYDAARELLAAMKAVKIDVIALKGLYLAEGVYKNIALRPRADVDILVRKDDLSSAVEVLTELGYAPAEPFQREAECTYFNHLPPFFRPDSPMIEIHWALEVPTSPFSIDRDGLWRRARPTNIAGVSVLTLSPEDTLLHLCLHAAYRHRLAFGLRPFCDISVILGYFQGQVDWEGLVSRAKEWGVCRAVYLMFYFSNTLFNLEIPGEVLQLLKPLQDGEAIVLLARDRIFEGNCGNGLPLTPEIARLWSATGVSRKVAIFFERLFLPPRALGENYRALSRSWRRLRYFPVRLMYLLRRYHLTVWKLIRGDEEMLGSLKRQAAANRLADWLSKP